MENKKVKVEGFSRSVKGQMLTIHFILQLAKASARSEIVGAGFKTAEHCTELYRQHSSPLPEAVGGKAEYLKYLLPSCWASKVPQMLFQVSPCPHLVQTGCCQLSSSSIPFLLPPPSHLLPPRHLAATPITTGTSQPPDIPISTSNLFCHHQKFTCAAQKFLHG